MRQNLKRSGGSKEKNVSRQKASLRSIFAAMCAVAVFLLIASIASRGASPRLQESQANVNTETVHYDSGGSNISAYLARPTGEGKHPAVIVVHDNQGLTDSIRAITRQFADAGFVALSPDLLSRVGGTTTPQQAAGAIRNLSLNGSVEDLKAAFEYLQKDSSVDSTKISAVGYGWGGWRSFMLAADQPGLYRAVVYSGTTPSDGLPNVQAPVLAHYAQFDFRVTGNAILTQNTMQQLGKKYSFYIYPGTERDFFNASGPRYNAEASKLAWTRTMDFLKSRS